MMREYLLGVNVNRWWKLCFFFGVVSVGFTVVVFITNTWWPLIVQVVTGALAIFFELKALRS